MSLRVYIRSVVRPVLTVVGFGCWIVFIWQGIGYPAAFEGVVIGMVGWWFAERTWRKKRAMEAKEKAKAEGA